MHGNDLTVDALWRREMQELGATVDEQGRAAADWETGVEDDGPEATPEGKARHLWLLEELRKVIGDIPKEPGDDDM